MRYALLDLYRGFLAIWVAISHFHIFLYYVEGPSSVIPQEFIQRFASHASVAVNLFWIISGVALSSVYGQSNTTRSNFFKRRFIRIYPLHILTLFIIIAISIAYNWITGKVLNERNTIKNFLLNIFLVSEWFPNSRSYNFVLWSVSAEIAIYILFSLCYRKLFAMQGAIIFLWIAFFCFLEFAFPTYYIFKCGKYFFGGVALEFLLSRRSYGKLLCLMATIILLSNYQVKAFLFSLSLLSILLLMKLSAKGKSSQTNFSKICSLSANLSYEIYLLHLPMIYLAILCFSFFQIESVNIVGTWVCLLIYLFSLIAISKLVFKHYDEPIGTFLKAKLFRD
jgi:peptidoglycan/LPS O-acetylase OafA/YrhL